MEEDLTCPVCSEIFRDPVVLSCSHSFCKGCLETFWMTDIAKTCPACRRRSSRGNPPSNLALRNLCETFSDKASNPRLEMRSAPNPEVLCSQHREKLKLFCLEDAQPICVDCVTTDHRNHTFCSTQEALYHYKEKLESAMKPVHERLETFRRHGDACDLTILTRMNQVKFIEKSIKEEFTKLHLFLDGEEAAAIAIMKEEEQQKSEIMKEQIDMTTAVTQSLSSTIKELNQEMSAETMSFLQNCKTIEKKIGELDTLKEPEGIHGTLLDVAKHVGNLGYRVWEKMLRIVQYTPVTLDPNSAHPMITISNDLTTMGCTTKTQQLPDNPERFDAYVQVLGSESFISGKHYWDIEVGDNPNWLLGVVTESVKRKGQLSTLSPDGGLWSIWHREGTFVAVTLPQTTLIVKNKPRRVRVLLDWDRGEVAFSDPENNWLLYKYKHRFTERVFPLLSTLRDPPLKITPARVSVLVERQFNK